MKSRIKIRGRAADATDADKNQENEQNHGGHGFLEVGAKADATVVDGRQEQRERDTQDEPREKDRLARDAIKLEGIEPWENVGGDFSEGDSLPRADDEVSKKHHPAGEVADNGRENLGGVGGFAGGVRKALDPLAVDIADGKQNDSADGKAECGSGGTAATEPVVHEDKPAGADHGTEGEREIIVQAKFAREYWHLEDAEQFVKEIGGEERSDFAGVVGRRDLDEVAADDVEAAQGANEFENLDAS